jgi:3-oxoacyl-[acyl-carrier protein] reductase
MNKVLLVTGASSDVGSALVERVADNYTKIICHYCSSTSVIERLQSKFGDKIVPISADFSNEASTAAFTQTVLDMDAAPTHFVHLSSSSDSSVNIKFAKTNREQFQRELDITFLSAVVCCEAFVPLMVKAKYGKVVFMLSSQIVWEPAKPYSTAYTCVKYALFGLMKTLSAEYMSKGVTVNAVSPSMINTKFLRIPDIIKQTNIESSPIKRLLTVDDVVPAFEFLLSSGADTVTGENLEVMAGN